jgi:hypothetical protein
VSLEDLDPQEVWQSLVLYSREHPTIVKKTLKKLLGDMEGKKSKMWILPLVAALGRL